MVGMDVKIFFKDGEILRIEGLEGLEWNELFQKIDEIIKQNFPEVSIHKGEHCNDDEAIHYMCKGQILHVCFSDPSDILVIPEIKCEKCGEFITVNILSVHEC